MLGWWAVFDVAKYLRRGSLYEAVARIETARDQALRLHATGEEIPFPSFGLTSLLDYPPFEFPASLGDCYSIPTNRRSVEGAARAVAELLAAGQAHAEAILRTNLETPWKYSAMERLQTALTAT